MLGDYVRERRLALGMTQEDLADAINRNQRYVSRLENNMKELPDPEMLASIAAALDTSVDNLLRAAGYSVGGDAEPVKRGRLWAGLEGDFTPDEEAIIAAVVEQIRKNRRG